MRAVIASTVVVLTAGLLWGGSVFVRLFDEERSAALAFLDAEQARVADAQSGMLVNALLEETSLLPKTMTLPEIAVRQELHGLLAVDGDHQVWPPAPPTIERRDAFEAAWANGSGKGTPSDVVEHERLRLAGEVIGAVQSSSDVRASLQALRSHRARYRLSAGFEAHSILRVVEAFALATGARATGATAPASTRETALFFAGQPHQRDVPRGLFALALDARSQASPGRVEELTERIAAAATAFELPVSTWNHAMNVPTLHVSPAALNRAIAGEGCRWISLGEVRWVGCRRGATWTGREFSPTTWLDGWAATQRNIAKDPSLAFGWAPLGTNEPTGRVKTLPGKIEVTSAKWNERRERISDYHRAKLSLLGLAMLLVGGVVALSVYVRRTSEQWVAAKEGLLQAVSHELKTPVASIRLLAETLERRLESESAARDYPRRIVREADRMQHLTDNLLSFQRVSKGKWRLVYETIDIDELLHEVLLDVESLKNDGDEITLEVAANIELRADRELLHLSIRNLVKNALHYSPSPATVAVEVRAVGENAEILVRDTGPGISRDLKPGLFEAFVRGTDGPSGTGLGLALSRSAMRYHGGDASLRSSSTAGSTFCLSLPLEPAGARQ